MPGGVLDDEMLMALPPEYVAKAIEGMIALAKNGFRDPFRGPESSRMCVTAWPKAIPIVLPRNPAAGIGEECVYRS